MATHTEYLGAKGSYNAPPMDAVQEVGDPAESPRTRNSASAPAAVLTLRMKSGTNEYHGTAYYFGRNPALNALANSHHARREYHARRTSGAAPSAIRSSRTSCSSSPPTSSGGRHSPSQGDRHFARRRWSAAATSPNRSHPSGGLRTIYDPITTAVRSGDCAYVTRTPFAGNMIPHEPHGSYRAKDPEAICGSQTVPATIPSGLNNFKKAYSWWINYWNISDRVGLQHQRQVAHVRPIQQIRNPS